MNWLDFVFIGILAISVIISLFRGLIKEVLSLVIWASAFWVAYNFVDVGADSLTSYIEVPSARHLIAFVALFIAALIVGGLLNFIVARLIKKTGLSGTDRFFGMFFGALRGLIAIVAITFFIQATPLSEDPWWQESKLAPQFSKISEWVRLNMPEEFSKYFSFIEQGKEAKMQELIEKLNGPQDQPINETQ
ncbi:MAG: CvpA family protein [Proteobacteria bacterium]|nr:CvpA family protein [Pseudomonadota bacterium]